MRSGCTIRWLCVLRLQPLPLAFPPHPAPTPHRSCAPRLFHLLTTPPCYPHCCEEPNAVCTLRWKWKCLQSCHFYDTRFTWICLYELTGPVVVSLIIDIKTTGGYTIGNSLLDKIINENFIKQTQISEWNGQKREPDSRLRRRKFFSVSLPCVQNYSGTHRGDCPLRTGESVPRWKSRQHLGLSLSFKQCRGKNEWNLKLSPLICFRSWRSEKLLNRTK